MTRTILTVSLAILVGLLILMTVLGGVGSVRWNRATREAVDALVERADPQGVEADAARSAGIPAPVARYLDRAIPEGSPDIRVARLQQEGEFLTSPPDGWAPFTATQTFTEHPPGMVWDARIAMAPGLAVRVRDRYGDQEGSIHGALLGLVPILKEGGTPAMARASLVRYLAESPWFPTRLRPSRTLTWTAVDDSTAVATIRDGEVQASLEFRFAGGEIRSVYARERYRGEDADPVRAPWIGHFSAYETVEGFGIPTFGEVAWVLDGEERPYWRGTITGAAYDF